MTSKTIRAVTSITVAAALLACNAASAAVLTVGPGGIYPTVQAALDDAVALAGDDEIRIRDGTFTENLSVDLGASGDMLEISGGWDAAFATASMARTTIIDGDGVDKVFVVRTGGADHFVLHGMVLRNGRDTRRAGVDITAEGTSAIELYNLTIRDNVAEDPRTDSAGLWVDLLDGADLQLSDCDITANTANSTGTVDGRGGGLTLRQRDTATATVVGNRITENVVTVAGAGSGLGAGADITQFDPGTMLTMTGNVIRANRITADSATGIGLLLSGSNWTLRRNIVAENVDDDAVAFGAQLSLAALDGTGILTDSLIVNGNARGVQIFANDDAIIRANNLTIANHPNERGLLANVNGTGVLSVHNTISVDNGTNAQLNPGVTGGNNTFFDDPSLFVDAAAGNYRLAPGAAAIDAGDDSPPGGLGGTDLDGGPRISGTAVDRGAYEATDVLFVDGFESD